MHNIVGRGGRRGRATYQQPVELALKKADF